MDFRKIGWICLMLILTNQVSAQTDSTDLDFYGTPFVPQNLEDSLSYGTEGFVSLSLEFNLESALIHGFRVEIVASNEEGIQQSLSNEFYQVTELPGVSLPDSNHVTISLGTYWVGYSYQIFLTCIDQNGHEVTTITKYLEQ